MCNPSLGATEPLSVRLRTGTRKVHRSVEKVQFIRSFLKGMLHRESYLQYLRDLYVVYSALEQQLSFHNRNPKLSALFLPALFRSAALRRDLICLAGPDFERRISPSPVAIEYARALVRLSHTQPYLLSAHAYTRYLGDLSGGQVLHKMAQLGLGISGPEGLSFYQFPLVSDVPAMRVLYRQQLDLLPLSGDEMTAIVDEACRAFAWNQSLLVQLPVPAVRFSETPRFVAQAIQNAG